MSQHNCKKQIDEIKTQLIKLRNTGDQNLRLGFSKIDFNAEEKAANFREARYEKLKGQNIDMDLETKMMEFQDLNTYIQQYKEKLGCNKDGHQEQTAVDRIFGVSHEEEGLEGCKIDY